MTNSSDRCLFEAEDVGLQVTCFTSLEPDHPDMGIDDLHVLQEGAVHPVPVRDDEMRFIHDDEIERAQIAGIVLQTEPSPTPACCRECHIHQAKRKKRRKKRGDGIFLFVRLTFFSYTIYFM